MNRLRAIWASPRIQSVLYALGGGVFLYLLGTANSTPTLLLAFLVLAVSTVLIARLTEARSSTPTLTAVPAAEDIRAALDNFLVSIRSRVADDLYAKALSIRRSINATIPANGATNDVADPNVYLIRQTAMSYLPEAFATYTALPRATAERQAVAGGQTPHDALLAQLTLMDERLADVATAIATHDSNKLLANGRFLSEKFGTSALRVDAPVSIGAPIAVAEESDTRVRTR